MSDLLFKELSFKLTGLVYEVDNVIGYGQNEKTYADALEKLLFRDNIIYQREVYAPIVIEGAVIKKFYFDFLVDDSIILELKANDINYKQVCSQLFKYLKSSGKQLGIIYRFTKSGARVKRIPVFIN